MNFNNDIRALLFGFGKMAQIHAKYLDFLKINWDWYDPYVNGAQHPNRIKELTPTNIRDYSHVLICTPETHHYTNYIELRRLPFKGKIFLEKPAVLNMKELYILNDKKLQVGMVERFNPCIDVLKRFTAEDDCISIDFSRCSFSPLSNKKVSSFVDVGIHDIDLFFYLFETPTIIERSFSRHKDTFTLSVVFNGGSLARFIWSNDTFARERAITLRLHSSTLKCDLIEQTVVSHTSLTSRDNLYVEKGSPIKRELEDFFFSKRALDTQASHAFFINALDIFSF